jgi:hypothetical protein
MKKYITVEDKEWLKKAVEALMEENQRYFLGVLQALVFAQREQGRAEAEQGECPVHPA